MAFFNEGLLDQVVECIPTCLEGNEEPSFEPITVEQHLRARYGGSYKNQWVLGMVPRLAFCIIGLLGLCFDKHSFVPLEGSAHFRTNGVLWSIISLATRDHFRGTYTSTPTVFPDVER